MNNKKVPCTPFSTQLSGSARELEIRLRNIMSGPKKRPPIPFLILIFSICIFCGNIVSCQRQPAQPTIVMETQYYDSRDNLIEIPALALPAGEENEAVEAINAALNDLRREYAQLSSRTGTDALENHCLFYPSTTDRYLNLLFFQDYFKTDLNTGHVFSLVYDKKSGELVSAEDALALAGLNEKALLDQVAEQMEPELNPEGQEYQLALHDLALEGFRIQADGQPVFYLTGRMDDADDAVMDVVSGADQLFVWADRAVTIYDQYGLSVPLVPAEDTDKLDPPLWNQWYFAGEEPAGGFVDKSLLEAPDTSGGTEQNTQDAPDPVSPPDNTPASDNTSAPASSQPAADLRAVLLGDLAFTDAETGLVLDISRVTEAVTSNADFTAKPVRFAYLDIDRDIDRTEDAVLWLATEEGDPVLAFIVLHWQGKGQVYGYTRFPRSFGGLKQDGAFNFSSSAADYGVGKLMFTASLEEGAPDECATWDIALQERVDSDWDRLSWHVQGAPATQAEFDAAWEEYDAKEDAVWHDFTPEIIERVIS